MSALIIDASSLLYRYYYASLKKEEKVYAGNFDATGLVGFCSRLYYIRTGQMGGYRFNTIIMAMDSRGESIRRMIYPPYKTNRTEKPDDLKWQLAQIPALSDAFGIKCASEPGYEADDVIATYVRELRASGEDDIVIMTSDKDLMQLLRPGVVISAPDMRSEDGSMSIETTEHAIAKFGVEPDLIPDVQALSGDSSDNIPGAPGIGEKTAAALIAQFGTLDAVLANAHLISKPKQRETLMNPDVQKLVRVSRRLAVLYDDILLSDPVSAFEPRVDWHPDAERYCLSVGATITADRISKL